VFIVHVADESHPAAADRERSAACDEDLDSLDAYRVEEANRLNLLVYQLGVFERHSTFTGVFRFVSLAELSQFGLGVREQEKDRVFDVDRALARTSVP
jgi:hypothetical protein